MTAYRTDLDDQRSPHRRPLRRCPCLGLTFLPNRRGAARPP